MIKATEKSKIIAFIAIRSDFNNMSDGVLDEFQKRKVIKAALEGKTLKVIREEIGIDIETFHNTKKRDKAFAQDWEEARLEGFDERADALLDLSQDETVAVDRAKLISDNTRWLLSKQKAKTYGDKIDINANHSLDISTILAEAKSRAVASIDTDAVRHEKVIDAVRDVSFRPAPTYSRPEPDDNDTMHNESNQLLANPELVDPFS